MLKERLEDHETTGPRDYGTTDAGQLPSSIEHPGSRIEAYQGDLASGTEVAPPARPKDGAGEPRFVRESRVTRQEWAPSILIFVIDVLTWTAIYGMASYLRDHNAAFAGSFQFAVIEIIQ